MYYIVVSTTIDVFQDRTYTEVVRSSSSLPQVGREECRLKSALDGVKEGSLRRRRDGVDAAEGEPDKAVVVRVRDELRGHRGGSLNGLLCGRGGTYHNGVGIDLPGRAAAVAVANAPALAC